MGDRPVTVRLDSAGGAVGGAMIGQAGETPILEGGTTDSTAVTWSVMFNGAMGEMKLDFSGAVNDASIAGTVQFGGFGSGTFSGTRAA